MERNSKEADKDKEAKSPKQQWGSQVHGSDFSASNQGDEEAKEENAFGPAK